MKTITRRAAIAASITLPLLPVSAFAAPAVEAESDEGGVPARGTMAGTV